MRSSGILRLTGFRRFTHPSPGLYVLDPKTDLSQLSKNPVLSSKPYRDDIIPEALLYVRPFSVSELSNGLRVVTERSDSPVAQVTVSVEAGSRHEGTRSSGLSYILTKLQTDCNTEVTAKLEDVGAKFSVKPGKEVTQYRMEVLSEKLSTAFESFATLFSSNKFTQPDFDSVRRRTLNEISREYTPFDLVLESIHSVAFRNHVLGSPLKGISTSLQSLLLTDIDWFYDSLYRGPRIVVSGTGNVEHNVLVDLSEKHLGKMRRFGPEINITEPPPLTGSQAHVRNSEIDQVYAGVFFRGPSRVHEDFHAFQLLRHLMSDYDPVSNGVAGLPGVQTCYLHSWLRDIEDITEHRSVYTAYRDTGLFGHFLGCLDLGAHIAPMAAIKACHKAGADISDIELSRGRNHLFRSLLSQENSLQATAEAIGLDLLYLKRRVPPAETAARAMLMDSKYLQKVYQKWLWNCDLAVAFYGNNLPERKYAEYRAFTIESKR